MWLLTLEQYGAEHGHFSITASPPDGEVCVTTGAPVCLLSNTLIQSSRDVDDDDIQTPYKTPALQVKKPTKSLIYSICFLLLCFFYFSLFCIVTTNYLQPAMATRQTNPTPR